MDGACYSFSGFSCSAASAAIAYDRNSEIASRSDQLTALFAVRKTAVAWILVARDERK